MSDSTLYLRRLVLQPESCPGPAVQAELRTLQCWVNDRASGGNPEMSVELGMRKRDLANDASSGSPTRYWFVHPARGDHLPVGYIAAREAPGRHPVFELHLELADFRDDESARRLIRSCVACLPLLGMPENSLTWTASGGDEPRFNRLFHQVLRDAGRGLAQEAAVWRAPTSALRHESFVGASFSVVTGRGDPPPQHREELVRLRAQLVLAQPDKQEASPTPLDKGPSHAVAAVYAIALNEGQPVALAEALPANEERNIFYHSVTVVDEAFRGKGLGFLVKAKIAEALTFYVSPGSILYSWTDVQNTSIVRLNQSLGYSRVATERVWKYT